MTPKGNELKKFEGNLLNAGNVFKNTKQEYSKLSQFSEWIFKDWNFLMKNSYETLIPCSMEHGTDSMGNCN